MAEITSTSFPLLSAGRIKVTLAGTILPLWLLQQDVRTIKPWITDLKELLNKKKKSLQVWGQGRTEKHVARPKGEAEETQRLLRE